MIEYINGNLFNTNIRTIVHGCNAQGIMGAGIAKTLRVLYPEAYTHYKNSPRLSLGNIYPVESNDKIIVNAITQEYYGTVGIRYVSYDAVSECMNKLNSFCNTNNITEVAMPQIGAGLGGGDWAVIAAIIESELTTVKTVVYYI